MLQGTAGYRQIRSTIQEELAAAERLQASLETERPLSGAKGSLFLLPAWERVMLWRPLANRLEAEGTTPSAEEQDELWREFEWAKSLQMRLSRRVAWYQLAFMLGIGIFAIAPIEIEQGRGDFQHLATILPYLLAAFWGAVGGCAASLWQLLKEVEGRSLSPASGTSHLLKPYLGAVLGLLVSLILPTNLLDISGSDINLTGYALAALAGLSERTFINKLQQLLEVLLGQAVSSKTTTAPTTSARPSSTAATPVAEGGASTAPPSQTATLPSAPTATQPIATVASALQSPASPGASVTPADLAQPGEGK